jgi:lauroyl/myristoyl acyltransferase
MSSFKARLRNALKPLGEAAVGALTIGLLRTTRYFDPDKTANAFGRIVRLIGPALREQRIGRANLTAAFPEKSPEEIETILAGVWDNLGRVGAEFAHIDKIWDYDEDHPERAISPIGSCPRSPPSRTGSMPPSSIAGQTLPPPTGSSRRCGRSIWER